MTQLTILTPTHNRPHFLNRLLAFFSEVQMGYPVRVVDSSDADNAKLNQQLVDEHPSLDITYEHHNLSLMDKFTRGVLDISSPFVAFCADDDFQFPQMLSDCVGFLAANPDYATARGQVVNIGNGPGGFGSRFSCVMSSAFDVSQDDAAKRYVTMASDPYSTFYAVHQTAALQRAFRITNKCTEYAAARIYTEAMLIGLSAIVGKIKVLPGVHYIQQTHGDNDSCNTRRIADQTRGEELQERYRDGLAEALVAEADMSLEEARRLLDSNPLVTPGGGIGAKKFTPSHRKATRELRRLLARGGKALQQLRQRITSKTTTSVPGVIANPEVLPDHPHYAVALNHLRWHPHGYLGDTPLHTRLR